MKLETKSVNGPDAPMSSQTRAKLPRRRGTPAPDLLRAKSHVPLTRPNLVARPLLTAKLNAGLARKLTLISAPAGFGKTTLLGDWISQSKYRVAWFSIDEQDNEPARFWSYFIAALQSLQPTLGTQVFSLLQTSPAVPIESVLTELVNEIDAIPEDLVLVLDDYHLIQAKPIHQALNWFLEHLPLRLHLYISSRADLPLPLARMRARDELIELRVADLRLSVEQGMRFLNEVMGHQVTIKQAAALEARTEGWIAGLQLAGLSLRGQKDVDGFIAAFTGSHRFILDYLVEQVLARQSGQIQNFLLQTSLLERMNASLCDAVTGRADSQSVLEQLNAGDLFLLALDEQREWYRYHQLFAEVLRHRLRTSQLDAAPMLHRRASEWYEQNGFLADAIQHSLAARDFERAAEWIASQGVGIALAGQNHTVQGWLKLLPETLVRSRALLALVATVTFTLTDQLAAASMWMTHAEHALAPDAPKADVYQIRGWGAILRGEEALHIGDLERSVAVSRAGLAKVPENVPLRLPLLVRVARAFQVTGDVSSEAEQQLAAAIPIVREAGNVYTLMNNITYLARLQALQGRLHRAAATYEQARDDTRTSTSLVIIPGYYFGVSDLLREWNDLDAAREHLTRGMELTRTALTVEADVLTLGYLTKARVEFARGDSASAFEALDAFAGLARARRLVPEMAAEGDALRARIELGRGDLDAALRWARARVLSDADELNYIRESEYLTWARVQIAARQELHTVLPRMQRQLANAKAKGRGSSVIEILALCALAHHARGNAANAHDVLSEALSLAHREGFMRVFVDEGQTMQSLLVDTKAKNARQPRSALNAPLEYIARLLAAFPGSAALPAPKSEMAGPQIASMAVLSPRELQVLKLVVAGKTNREIADALVVAVSTVKAHTNTIYAKLNVASRSQAIRRVHELHLLE